MLLKNYSQAIEHTTFVEGKLPKSLLHEMEAFSKRNSLLIIASSVPDKKPIYHCCPNCLKAHIIKKAKRMNLKIDVEKLLSPLLNCEVGHGGYYIDGEKLIKV